MTSTPLPELDEILDRVLSQETSREVYTVVATLHNELKESNK